MKGKNGADVLLIGADTAKVNHEVAED